MLSLWLQEEFETPEGSDAAENPIELPPCVQFNQVKLSEARLDCTLLSHAINTQFKLMRLS